MFPHLDYDIISRSLFFKYNLLVDERLYCKENQIKTQ